LKQEQPEGFQVDLMYDDHTAEEEFARLGPRVVDYVMRSAFEGPFFTRLNTLSAAMVRRWLRALQACTFFQVDGGMDAPWLRLAQALDVRLNEPVETLRVGNNGVEVVAASSVRHYDAVVSAVPAPAAAKFKLRPGLADSG
jgi:protoporphyrinogen oxidase